MSIPLPKKVKDLFPLESDSSEDEEQTPKNSPTINNDKENINQGKKISGLPKRVSELSPLESESDEEDKPDDKLNCNILNDSFILTPNKSLEGMDDMTPIVKHNKKSPDKFYEDLALNTKGLSIYNKGNTYMQPQKQFKSRQMLFPDTPKLAANQEKIPLSIFSEISSKKNNDNDFTSLYPEKKIPPIKDRTDRNPSDRFHGVPHYLPPSAMLKRANSLIQKEAYQKVPIATLSRGNSAEIFRDSRPERRKIEQTDTRHIEFPVSETKAELETPLRTTNTNFVTPQFKSFQVPTVTRRLRPITGNKTQKTRLDIQEEFRSQKILFTTPVSSCPPLPPSANDSITLSLDDTMKAPKSDSKNTLSPPIKENINNKKKPENDIFDNFNKQIQEDVSQTSKKVIVINGKEFIIHKKMGTGGSSSVFAAVQKNNQRECALKIVSLQGDKTVVDGYLNETKLLAKLQGNVNVVALYEYEHLPKLSTLYMVMEKGDSDLHKILQTYKTTLPLYKLVNYWYQILQSVKYIHENGVIHSDLKPANFLMVNGRLKLIDFGIASNIAIDSTSIIKFSQAGTFNYISPEALIDTSTGNSPLSKNQPKIKVKLSTKSDVWSLGCILYLLLYKKTPFSHIKNIYAKINAISNPSTEISYPEMPYVYPPMLTEMAKKCLQHNPKKRISVPELLQYPFDLVIPIDNIK